MATDAEIKSIFISNALRNYGNKVTTSIKREILRLKAVNTEGLFNSLSFKVTSGNSSHQGKVEIIFHEYGRMVDMGVGRGAKNNRENRRDKLTNTRKSKKIYSPVAYGLITPLINELQYGYTQQAIDTIKQTLETNQP